MQSAERNRYLKEIRKALRPRRDKDVIMGRIMEDMEEYLAVNPEASIDQLRIVFGTPEDYTKEYVAGMDRNQFYTTVSAKWHRSLVCIIVASLLLTLSISVFASTLWYRQHSAVYYTAEVIDHGIVGEVVEEGTGPVNGTLIGIPDEIR